MGQGHYMALGFGMLDPPLRLFKTNAIDAIEKAAGRQLHTGHTSGRDYLAIFVAENAFVDDDAANPTTCNLSEASTGPAWEAARAAWNRARKAAKELGFTLPSGRALLIVDFD